MWVYTSYQARKDLRAGTVKIDPQKFCHLKQPYDSYIFKIYQKHLFLCCETKKSKITGLAFFKQENYYKKMKPVRRFYISKSFKKQIKKYYLLRSLGISWLFTKNLKESYYQLYQQTFLLITINGMEKISFGYYRFSVAINVFQRSLDGYMQKLLYTIIRC